MSPPTHDDLDDDEEEQAEREHAESEAIEDEQEAADLAKLRELAGISPGVKLILQRIDDRRFNKFDKRISILERRSRRQEVLTKKILEIVEIKQTLWTLAKWATGLIVFGGAVATLWRSIYPK